VLGLQALDLGLVSVVRSFRRPVGRGRGRI